MGEHGSKYRGCPYFRSLMENEMRNKSQSSSLNTIQSNPTPPNIDRQQSSLQSLSRPGPPFRTHHNLPPTYNAWTRPLNLAPAQPLPPPLPFSPNHPRTLVPHPPAAQLNRCPNPPPVNNLQPPIQNTNNGEPVISQNSPSPPSPFYGAETHSGCPASNQTGTQAPKKSTKKPNYNNQHSSIHHFPTHSNQNSAITSQLPYLTELVSLPVRPPPLFNPHQHPRQPPNQRLGNSKTEQQTNDFINRVRAFNPHFSFHYLLQSISIMLRQFTQHPYESALPIIFNTFLANLLAIPLNG
jgi:hypothetical protein